MVYDAEEIEAIPVAGAIITCHLSGMLFGMWF